MMNPWLAALAVSLILSAPNARDARKPKAPSTQPTTRATTLPAERCLYIPPGLAEHVTYYNSFDRGTGSPEVNSLGAQTRGPDEQAEGIAGMACHLPAGPSGARSVSLSAVSLPLHRPLTAMLWWKLKQPMAKTTGFHLVSLRGAGYVSNFVRGEGEWCALKEPTFVLQVWNWRGVSNHNGICYGHAWVDANQWHHAAVVISTGANVRVYWDGKPRADHTVKGRAFGPEDIIKSVELGGGGMTIDEPMILDKALSGEEIEDYVTAVRELSGMRAANTCHRVPPLVPPQLPPSTEVILMSRD